MSAANTIALGLELLLRSIEATQRIGAMIAKAQAEGRELNADELRQLRATDDASEARLANAIADARVRESAKPSQPTPGA